MKKNIKICVNFKAPKKKSYKKQDIKEGMKIEKEHTSDKKAQKIITKNHLDEDKKYYKKLKKMEKK